MEIGKNGTGILIAICVAFIGLVAWLWNGEDAKPERAKRRRRRPNRVAARVFVSFAVRTHARETCS
jgi:hypothetical protein